MKHPIARINRLGLACLSVFLIWPHASRAADFVDSTRVNVLRQYSPAGNLLVSETISGTGVVVQGANDGSGFPDMWQITDASAGTSTFTLPGPRTVGSFRADFRSPHFPSGGFLLEGFTGGSWVTLTNVASVAGPVAGSFTPQTVSSLRYTVTGPGAGLGYIQNSELQVFLSAGQTVPYDAGFNLLPDLGKVVSVTDSANGGPWSLRSSAFGGATSFDQDYLSGHVHGQNGRTFFALSLDQPTFINRGHLGWFHDQTWANYQVYASEAAVMPAVQSLSATDVATLTAAGWTLQLDSTDVVQKKLFSFAGGDGPWQHLLVVWNGTGALVEFEAFIPEPSTACLLAIGSLLLLRRR